MSPLSYQSLGQQILITNQEYHETLSHPYSYSNAYYWTKSSSIHSYNSVTDQYLERISSITPNHNASCPYQLI